MRIDYDTANGLYSLLVEQYDLTIEDELVRKLESAINLLDKCDEIYHSRIKISLNPVSISVKIKQSSEWPQFLIESINNDEDVELSSVTSGKIYVNIK